jgi:hypothetical protein
MYCRVFIKGDILRDCHLAFFSGMTLEKSHSGRRVVCKGNSLERFIWTTMLSSLVGGYYTLAAE